MINIIAHRGIHDHLTKENTYSSISKAINSNKTVGVEFDIRLTADKKIVIIHDSKIDRTSNGSGIVELMTLKELQKYNFGTKDNYQTIPTLDKVLDSINSDKIILIEVKTRNNEKYFADILYDIIKNYSHLNIYITSFNKTILYYLHKKDPTLKLGPFVYLRRNITYKCHFNAILSNIISRGIVISAVKRKKEIIIWNVKNSFTINSLRERLGTLINNVYIITDNISFND